MFSLKISDREQRALDLRASGELYRTISETIGVSEARASIIVKKAKEKKECVAILEELKTKNALYDINIADIPTINERLAGIFADAGIFMLIDVLRMSKEKLSKIDYLDKAGIERLEAALDVLGYRLSDE